ncbi:MAG: tetratricopeptide repeat protein, partial [Moorea sp. SIO2I5]|nr:tetratricopeptide repeat protein [Moorena sp. SIO2I5]
PKDWWWHLDSKEVNWLIRGLTVITWTGSLGLLANIASRFLSGGVGVLGAAAVVFPSFLTLLEARSELTEAGREGLEKLITKLGIPQYCREEAKFTPLLALSGLLLGFWFALPLISQAYNHEGEKNYQQGQLGAAEENYLRAIALNPDNIDAHHNLGNLYEELQQFDKARTEYLIAVKGDVPEAYNNLARLFIQKKQYPEAVALLKQGLLLQAGQQDSFPEDKYNLFKNLGWARFQQGRDTEAEQALKTATGIASNPEVAQYLQNQGSAHCLLAQVLERQKKPGAIQQWQQCCWLGSTLNPDEDTWLHLAQKKLQEAKKSCEQL